MFLGLDSTSPPNPDVVVSPGAADLNKSSWTASGTAVEPTTIYDEDGEQLKE